MVSSCSSSQAAAAALSLDACDSRIPPELRHFRLPLLATRQPRQAASSLPAAAAAAEQQRHASRSQQPADVPYCIAHKLLDFPRLANAVLASRGLSSSEDAQGAATASLSARHVQQSSMKKQMTWLSPNQRLTFSKRIWRSRCLNPGDKETLSTGIRWTLEPAATNMKQNKRKCQGPYSRELLITCSAPAIWMRQKWGRSRTAQTGTARRTT